MTDAWAEARARTLYVKAWLHAHSKERSDYGTEVNPWYGLEKGEVTPFVQGLDYAIL